MNDIHIKTADDIIYHLVRDPIRLIVDELVMIEVEFIIVIISRKLVNSSYKTLSWSIWPKLQVASFLSLGSEYDSYGTSGVDYSPPPSPRYSHKHSQMRRSSKHSPDR